MSLASSVVPHLIDILDREEAECDRLLATLREERTAIRRLTLSDFNTINERRLGILHALETIEADRRHAMARLADTWGVPSDSLTLHTVIDRLKTAGAQELEERHTRLAHTIRTAREEISLNARLIDGIQAFIEKVLHAWTEAAPKEGTYSSSGECRPGGTGGAFLRQRG